MKTERHPIIKQICEIAEKHRKNFPENYEKRTPRTREEKRNGPAEVWKMEEVGFGPCSYWMQ